MTRLRVTTARPPSLRASLPDAVLEALQDAPALAWLTRSRTTDTSLVDLPPLGAVVRKRWTWPGLADRVKGLGRTTALARTPAEREWAALARTYGPSATRFHPRPLGLRVERRGAFAVRAMLLLEEVPEAVDLATFLRDATDGTLRRDVLADLARRVRAMHEDGVADGDLHPRNLLVQPAARRVWKVDCARQRVHAAPLGDRRASHDLGCVDVGLERFASRAERLRALLVYLDVPRSGADVRARAAAITAWRQRLAREEAGRLPPAAIE